MKQVFEKVTSPTRRDVARQIEDVSAELARLTAPVLSGAIELAQLAEKAAQSSTDRFKQYDAEYPFVDYPRMCPAYVLVGGLVSFLALYAGDSRAYKAGVKGLGDFVDGGPRRLKKLLMAGSLPEFGIKTAADADENDLQLALDAHRALQLALVSDLRPLFKPIESYVSMTIANSKAARARRSELQAAGLTGYNPGWDGTGLSSLLCRYILTVPGGRAELEADDRNMSFWARAGQPAAERPDYLDVRFVQVKTGGGPPRWIPAAELKDFIAGK